MVTHLSFNDMLDALKKHNNISQNQYNKSSEFIQNLSQKDLKSLLDIILQKPGTHLTELDKYSIEEFDILCKLFPIETITKAVLNRIKKFNKFGLYCIADYRVYNTNKIILKNLKNYRKNRLKIKKD